MMGFLSALPGCSQDPLCFLLNTQNGMTTTLSAKHESMIWLLRRLPFYLYHNSDFLCPANLLFFAYNKYDVYSTLALVLPT